MPESTKNPGRQKAFGVAGVLAVIAVLVRWLPVAPEAPVLVLWLTILFGLGAVASLVIGLLMRPGSTLRAPSRRGWSAIAGGTVAVALVFTVAAISTAARQSEEEDQRAAAALAAEIRTNPYPDERAGFPRRGESTRFGSSVQTDDGLSITASEPTAMADQDWPDPRVALEFTVTLSNDSDDPIGINPLVFCDSAGVSVAMEYPDEDYFPESPTLEPGESQSWPVAIRVRDVGSIRCYIYPLDQGGSDDPRYTFERS